jgi:DNA topoisomerase I
MKLVIVETPAQAKMLTDVLDDGWRVEPCYGLVRDLVDGELGIDPVADFRPTFAVAPGKGNLVRRLMKAVRACEAVYAATPPRRTGEVMAWHGLALSPDAKDKPIYRVSLPALTPDAIRAACAASRPLNLNWIDAELALRLVNRLAGYTVNGAAQQRGDHHPVSRTSQVALCRLAQRENVIARHTPVERWTVKVWLKLEDAEVETILHHADGAPVAFSSQDKAETAATGLRGAEYRVVKAGLRETERSAPTPYTLGALLVDAEHQLGIPPEETLGLIGTLYDASWITHPLGEVSETRVEAARTYLRREYGTDYVSSALVTPINGSASTDVNRVPEDLPGDGAALYGLIWRRFVAALLPPGCASPGCCCWQARIAPIHSRCGCGQSGRWSPSTVGCACCPANSRKRTGICPLCAKAMAHSSRRNSRRSTCL